MKWQTIGLGGTLFAPTLIIELVSETNSINAKSHSRGSVFVTWLDPDYHSQDIYSILRELRIY